MAPGWNKGPPLSRFGLLLIAGALLMAFPASPISGGVFDPNDSPRVREALSAIRIHPDSLELRLELCEIYRRLGTIEGRRLAAREYAEFLKRRPHHLGALVAFGQLRVEQGFKREAEKLFRRALRIEPRSATALFGVAELALHDYRRYLD
jgi:hypothetical protein